jgi:hypothetical protein
MPRDVVVTGALRYKRGGTMGNSALPVILIDAYNNSSGAIACGDVVIIDNTNSSADLIYFTTTTSLSDTKVLGMAYTAIANGKIGPIQIWGPTDALKVNGTTDIAKGDYIGTYSAVKIGAKTSGTGAFARAMEAYATNDSAGVIDAMILGMGAMAVSPDISATEIGFLDGVTAGTVTASKAVVAGTNGEVNSLAFGGASTGLLLGGGATGAKVTTAAVDKKFAEFYTDTTATSGDSRGIYWRHYLSGAGVSGDAARFWATANAAVAGCVGAHITASIAVGASVSGLMAGVRATLDVAAASRSVGGTITALQIDSNVGAGNTLPATASLIRLAKAGSVDVTTFMDISDDQCLKGSAASGAATDALPVRMPNGSTLYISLIAAS